MRSLFGGSGGGRFRFVSGRTIRLALGDGSFFFFFTPTFILRGFSFYDRMICAVRACVCACSPAEQQVAQGAGEAGEGRQDGKGRNAHG